MTIEEFKLMFWSLIGGIGIAGLILLVIMILTKGDKEDYKLLSIAGSIIGLFMMTCVGWISLYWEIMN